MSTGLWDRLSGRLAKLAWFTVLLMFGLYGFGMFILPRMIHHWDAERAAVPASVRQFVLDASNLYVKARFTLLPFLLLLAVWLTVRAIRVGN